MKMNCFGCGIEKDTAVKEFYTAADDRLTHDIPIDPLIVLCVSPATEDGVWRHAVVCHTCFSKLDVDMWIGERCWLGLGPAIKFEDLPLHADDHGDLRPENYAK